MLVYEYRTEGGGKRKGKEKRKEKENQNHASIWLRAESGTFEIRIVIRSKATLIRAAIDCA